MCVYYFVIFWFNVYVFICIIGIEVKQMKEHNFYYLRRLTKEILKKFNMHDCKLVNMHAKCGVKLSIYKDGEKFDPILFKSLVGSLRYLTFMRPNILYRVGLMSLVIKQQKMMHIKLKKALQ